MSFMKGVKIFLDTNILVYAYDSSSGDKQAKAGISVAELWEAPILPAISVQVLQEFFVTLVRKKVSLIEADKIVRSYYDWSVVENTTELLSASFNEQRKFKLSFWDASVLAAARFAKCSEIWSEDFNTGQSYDGIRVINPLK